MADVFSFQGQKGFTVERHSDNTLEIKAADGYVINNVRWSPSNGIVSDSGDVVLGIEEISIKTLPERVAIGEFITFLAGSVPTQIEFAPARPEFRNGDPLDAAIVEITARGKPATFSTSHEGLTFEGSTLLPLEGYTFGVGTIDVLVEATNENGTALIAIPLTIVAVAPTSITPLDGPIVIPGGTLTGQTIQSFSADGDEPVWTTDLPNFFFSGSELKVFDGDLLTPGQLAGTVTATNPSGSVSMSILIDTVNAPMWSPIPAIEGVDDVTIDLSAYLDTTDVTLSVAPSEGVEIQGLSVTFEAPVVGDFVITAQGDAEASSVTVSVTLTAVPAIEAPVAGTLQAVEGNAGGEPFVVNLLVAFSGDAPDSYAVSYGTVDGSNWTIPSVERATTETVTATNEGGTSAPVSLVIDIEAALEAVIVTPPTFTGTLEVGQVFAQNALPVLSDGYTAAFKEWRIDSLVVTDPTGVQGVLTAVYDATHPSAPAAVVSYEVGTIAPAVVVAPGLEAGASFHALYGTDNPNNAAINTAIDDFTGTQGTVRQNVTQNAGFIRIGNDGGMNLNHNNFGTEFTRIAVIRSNTGDSRSWVLGDNVANGDDGMHLVAYGSGQNADVSTLGVLGADSNISELPLRQDEWMVVATAYEFVDQLDRQINEAASFVSDPAANLFYVTEVNGGGYAGSGDLWLGNAYNRSGWNTGEIDVAEVIIFPRRLSRNEIAKIAVRSVDRLAARGLTLAVGEPLAEYPLYTETALAPGAATMSSDFVYTTPEGFQGGLDFFAVDGADEPTTTPIQVKIGKDFNGKPCVYSDGVDKFWVKAKNEPFLDQHGYVIGGGMLNPNLSGEAPVQGWSEAMGEAKIDGKGDATAVPYSAAENVLIEGFLVSPGFEASLVMSHPKIDYSPVLTDIVEDYPVFTFMDAVPARADFLRAPTILVNKTPRRFADDIILANFPSLPTPSSGAMDPQLYKQPDWSPRKAGPLENGEDGNRAEAMGRYYSAYYLEDSIAGFYEALDAATSAARKKSLLAEYVTQADDFFAAIEVSGWQGKHGAGQNQERAFWLFVLSYAFNDQSVLDEAVNHSTNALSTTGFPIYYGAANRANLATDKVNTWPNSNGSRNQEVFEDHIGRMAVTADGNGTHLNARYGPIVIKAYPMEVLATFLLQGGPNNRAPWEEIYLRNGNTATDSSNLDFVWVAALAWTQSLRFDNTPSWFTDRYNEWFPTLTLPALTEPPAQPLLWVEPAGRNDKGVKIDITATGIAPNFDDMLGDFSIAPITQRDIEISVDGWQWKTYPNVLNDVEIALPTRGKYFVRAVLHNAHGVSIPSRHLDVDTANPDLDTLGIVMATGAEPAAAAPSFDVTPELIYQDTHNLYPGQHGKPVTLAKLSDARELIIGAGIPLGSPAPLALTPEGLAHGYEYKWQADLVDIPGETGQKIAMDQASLAGVSLRGAARVTNSEGTTAWEFTNAIAVPVAAVLPAQTVVDIVPTMAKARDQSSWFSGVSAESPDYGDIVVDPILTTAFPDGSHKRGMVFCETTDGSPQLYLPTQIVGDGSTQYEVLVDFAQDPQNIRSLRVSVRDDLGVDIVPISLMFDQAGFYQGENMIWLSGLFTPEAGRTYSTRIFWGTNNANTGATKLFRYQVLESEL